VALLGLVSWGALATHAHSQPTSPELPHQDSADQPPALETQEDYALMRLFVDMLDEVERNYVRPISRRELMDAAIEGLLSKLDHYSTYISPQDLAEFEREVEQEFGGIGIQLGMGDGKLLVISPLIGTPAHRAGILAGDHITRIDGQRTEGMGIDQAVALLKGKLGTDVRLTIRHEGRSESETLTLRREIVQLETVMSHQRLVGGGWDFMFDDDRRIGYIRVTAFSTHTVDALKSALDQLQADGMRGLILDLRFNPGGLLTAAVSMADLFLADGIIVSATGRNVPDQTWRANGPGTFADVPLIVLVNRFSASASEIVAASLQDHRRATIVGERTWGKGSVQRVIRLEGGRSALKLTTSSYRRPNGKSIDRSAAPERSDEWGVRPDPGFEIELAPDQVRQILRSHQDAFTLRRNPDNSQQESFFVDPQLEKAVALLTSILDQKAR
jgi:carboxyl-terminal processing protease